MRAQILCSLYCQIVRDVIKQLHSGLQKFICYIKKDIHVQMAKDVVTFLSWAAEPEADERKLVCI